MPNSHNEINQLLRFSDDPSAEHRPDNQTMAWWLSSSLEQLLPAPRFAKFSSVLKLVETWKYDPSIEARRESLPQTPRRMSRELLTVKQAFRLRDVPGRRLPKFDRRSPVGIPFLAAKFHQMRKASLADVWHPSRGGQKHDNRDPPFPHSRSSESIHRTIASNARPVGYLCVPFSIVSSVVGTRSSPSVSRIARTDSNAGSASPHSNRNC